MRWRDNDYRRQWRPTKCVFFFLLLFCWWMQESSACLLLLFRKWVVFAFRLLNGEMCILFLLIFCNFSLVFFFKEQNKNNNKNWFFPRWFVFPFIFRLISFAFSIKLRNLCTLFRLKISLFQVVLQNFSFTLIFVMNFSKYFHNFRCSFFWEKKNSLRTFAGAYEKHKILFNFLN